jgi:hypothetical protein
MSRFVLFLAGAVALLVGVRAHAADVRAWLDRNNMQLGESVTLNVEVSGDAKTPQPDFSALQQDFDVLGTQSSTSLNIVNGQSSAKLLWAVGLQPKRAGTLAIPSLQIAGQRTQPLTLTVQAAVAGTGGKAGDDLYIETTAEPRAPYVQQQVQYTVKLYFALNFSDGGLDDPQADGVAVHKLGQDTYYAADVGGRRYRVWERRYALTPEKSGAITLPAVTFRGHAIDPSDVNSFFTRGRAVTAHSDPIRLDVRTRPAASGADTWLPARALELAAQGIDANVAGRVGEPLTLTLHLKAQGLAFEQLPELKLPKIEGADVYPDKTTTQNHDDGQWLYGERERKFAIVPNRAGALVLPEMTLDWWDTAHDRGEVARVPSVTLQVQATAVRTPAHDTTVPNKLGENVPTMGTIGPAPVAEVAVWRGLALFALGLWALTLAAWIASVLVQRRRTAAPERDAVELTSSTARAQFRAAAAQGDAATAARALLAWAQALEPGLRNLGDLAARLEDSAQAQAVRDLDRARYGAEAITGKPPHIGILANGLQFRSSARNAQPSPLPPLYRVAK